MSIFNILSLVCGLALFLFGMNIMGDALKKRAGSRLKDILAKLTSSPWKGFLLGLGVTAIIQSSSATTVMVVGFVNAGTMLLSQAVGVIMGANVGTAVTAWITGLSGLGEGGASVVSFLNLLKPSTFTPVLAIIGIGLLMFSGKEKHKDIGTILMGFALLMVGMETMSDAVSVLRTNEQFKSILVMFENPILGVLAGAFLTAVVQSSSASVGILQSLSTTGAISYGAAVPIILGQNIGTCITAMLSSFGTTKNAKRAALVHLYFNVIGVIFWLSMFYLADFIFDFAFLSARIDMWGIALVHTTFKLLCVLLFSPFLKQLEKLAYISVRDSKEEEEVNALDERLLSTPAVAVQISEEEASKMAVLSCDAMKRSLPLLATYNKAVADEIRQAEGKADKYEDMLGTYLVKISERAMTSEEGHAVTKLLHIIGDFERISDHAVNVVESAEEMTEKKIQFSAEARRELGVLCDAIGEILDLATDAFVNADLKKAMLVEPLEQVVDELKDAIKRNHIQRLQRNECSIEHGFVLSDILVNLERVSDHCSNIAGCVIEISEHDALDLHEYLHEVKTSDQAFKENYNLFAEKYRLA